jgi:hypothetical protein
VVSAGRNFTAGYAHDLGVALQNNSSTFTSLCLTVRGLVGSGDELDTTNNAMSPLLQYIATSQALTSVEFLADERQEFVLLGQLLEAVAKNPNIVEIAAARDIHVPSETLTNFLKTACSIRKMSVRVGLLLHDPPHTTEMLVAALGQTATLQNLTLVRDASTAADGTIELILLELDASSMNLRALWLKTSGPCVFAGSEFHGLARFLSRTRTLSHLYLERFIIDTESMKVLVTALQCNQTVTCLSFAICKILAQETADLLAEFLQSSSSRIQELHFLPICYPTLVSASSDENLLGYQLVGVTVSKMMVRSSVTSLTLHQGTCGFVPCCDLLFDHLTHNEAASRLCTLTLRAVNGRVAKSLSEFLAESSRLQELSLVDRYRSKSVSLHLLSGIRQNGSLHSVVWEVEKGPNPSPSWLHWVTTYCKRNKMLPQLLSQKCAAVDGADGAGQVNSCVIPSLFCLARQARRTAPNAVFLGLLAALDSDVVGPRSQTGSKRVRSAK